MGEVEGIAKITEAVTKKGKKYLKVTVGDKYLYDWNFKAKDLDGIYCLAKYDGEDFPKITQIMPVDKPPVQATVTESNKPVQKEASNGSLINNLANSPQYLAAKLATEMVQVEQIAVDKKIERFEQMYNVILKKLMFTG